MINAKGFTMKAFYYLIIILFFSCTTQNLFQKNNSLGALDEYEPYTHVLKQDDKISLSIWNHDDLSIGSVYGVYNSNEVYGKWVMIDREGYVKLPELGAVKLAGLTVSEAKDTLTKIYGEFIKAPVIELKVLNLKVTILGEVNNPGTFPLDENNNTLIELIGRAGGVGFYSNKKKIKVVRGRIETGQAKHYYVDLTNMNDVASGKMYIYPDDIIYVPTKKGKMLDKKAPTLIPFASVISAMALITTVLLK